MSVVPFPNKPKPKRDLMITLRVEGELRDAIQRAAEKDCRTVAGLVRHVMLEWLERQETPNPNYRAPGL